MCQVHLVEASRTVCCTPAPGPCSYCERPIRGAWVQVTGTLDDGSPGTLRFAYHRDCADFMVYDVGDSGCFSYGTPLDEVRMQC